MEPAQGNDLDPQPVDTASAATDEPGLAPVNRKAKLPLQAASGVEYAKLLLRPSYHIRKLVDDVKAAHHALGNLDLAGIRHDEEALARAFRGRLFATFLLSGLFGVFGPVVGTLFQFISGHPIEAFLVGLVIANLFGTIGFQIIWYVAHRRLYAARQKSGLMRFVSLERDLLPMQWDGIRYTALFLLITVPIMLIIIKVLMTYAEPVARVLPFPVLAVVVEFLVIHSSLVRVMGDLFERHAHRIAHNDLVETHAMRNPA